MKDRTFSILAALSLCLSMPAWSEEPATAAPADEERAAVVEILEKADAAARKVRAVRFKASSEPSGVVTNFIGSATGEGYLEGWDETTRRPLKFWAHVQATAPNSKEASELTGGGDGESYFIIDHKNKKAYEDIDPGVLGTGGQTLSALGIPQFVHPEPYRRELAAKRLELLGTETVDGVECYQIQVTYDGGGPGGAEIGSLWSISTEDYLPRRRVRQFAIPQQGEGELVIALSNLQIDPEVSSDLFKLDLPEGYEQVDDFAP